MKKILLLIASSLLFSCYPRTSAVEIQKDSIDSHASLKDYSKMERKEDTEAKIASSEKTFDTKKAEEKRKDTASSTSKEKEQSGASENSSKVLKSKTYYPDGRLQSETELTESYSKIQSQLNEQIRSNQSLSESLRKSADSSNTLRSENTTLKKKLNEESDKRLQLESNFKKASKNKTKNTETEGFPWWGVLLGVAITMLCVVVYTKLKSKLSIIS